MKLIFLVAYRQTIFNYIKRTNFYDSLENKSPNPEPVDLSDLCVHLECSGETRKGGGNPKY